MPSLLALKVLREIKAIEERLAVTESSYIVYKDVDRIIVKNGRTGQIEYTDVDARRAIQYALDKVSSEGGGKVIIKSGEYQLTGSIFMRPNVILQGEGRSTILTGGNIDFSMENLENVVVKDIMIDNRGIGNCLWIAPPGGASNRWGPKNVLIENVIAYGSNDPAIGHAVVEIRSARNVIIRNSEIAYGGHNGIYIHRTGEGYEPSDIIIESCYIHDNYDDAIDPNYAKRLFITSNYIVNNQLSCCSLELDCEDVLFANNYVIGGRFIGIADSRRVLVANNYLYITYPGDYQWINSSHISFVNNFYGPRAFIHLNNSHSVSIISNHLWNRNYNDTVILARDSKGFVIKHNYFNAWNQDANRTEYIHPIVVDGTSDDYEFSDNFIENFAVCRAKFVGTRYRVKGNIANRRGYWISPVFHDYDGSMTDTANTPYTFEPQQGEVTIDTSTIGTKTGTISFPIRYPAGKIPRVLLTLADVQSGVVIDTVNVSNISETSFTWAINVVTAVPNTTCKLYWRSEL